MTTKSQRTPPRLIWLMRIPIIVALAASLFLMVSVLIDLDIIVEKCCGSLIEQQWAYVMGLPVTGIAAIFYACILVSTLSEIRRNRMTRTFLVFAAVAVAGTAVWFIALQFIEGSFCIFCMTIHTAGLVFTSAVFFNRRRLAPKVPVVPTTLFGFAAVLALATAQIYGPKTDTHDITEAVPPEPVEPVITTTQPEDIAAVSAEDQETEDPEPAPVPVPVFNPDTSKLGDNNAPVSPEPEIITGAGVHFGGQIIINPSAVPYVGETSATHTVTKFFDYTCASCRDSHGDLEKLMSIYPGKFRVLLIPCPLNTNCNAFVSNYTSTNHPGACELARYALSLWYAAPDKFLEYHHFLMKERLPIDLGRAKSELERLADGANLESEENQKWVDAQLESTFANYALLRQHNIKFPKLLLDESAIIHGTPRTTEIFLKAMARRFGLQYPPPSN